jgi:hypothetical protein
MLTNEKKNVKRGKKLNFKTNEISTIYRKLIKI